MRPEKDKLFIVGCFVMWVIQGYITRTVTAV